MLVPEECSVGLYPAAVQGGRHVLPTPAASAECRLLTTFRLTARADWPKSGKVGGA